MSAPAWLADVLYRYRLPISAFVLLGAIAFAPKANITSIDNDLSAWIAKDDPAYQDYERFRHEFGGTRPLIVALQGDGIFTATGLQYVDRITRDLEQVDRVERVQSLATANIVRSIPATRDDDGGIEVSPLLEGRLATDEQAVARLLAQGLSNEQIAARLGVRDKRSISRTNGQIYNAWGLNESTTDEKVARTRAALIIRAGRLIAWDEQGAPFILDARGEWIPFDLDS